MGGKPFGTALAIWAPVAVATTVVCFFINIAVQQSFRTAADDPQIQFAEDRAAKLAALAAPASEPNAIAVESMTPLDIAKSLAPWVAVYSDSGAPLASDGRLHGALPELPPGIFAYARDVGQIAYMEARGRTAHRAHLERVAGAKPSSLHPGVRYGKPSGAWIR